MKKKSATYNRVGKGILRNRCSLLVQETKVRHSVMVLTARRQGIFRPHNRQWLFAFTAPASHEGPKGIARHKAKKIPSAAQGKGVAQCGILAHPFV